jgi:hypothetical protein
MTNFALIKNGIIENTIVADIDFINSLPNPNDYVEFTNAGIGWSYDGANFIPPKCHDEAKLNDEFEWVCTNKDHDPII